MINPYEKINWKSVTRVGSATHMHIMDQKSLINGYKYGIRHFPISNYYPSAPYDANTKSSDFRLRQYWPNRRENGETIEPNINWNDIITWQDELNEPYRSELPFTEGELAFSNIPEDVIISPNAEHHSFSNSPHIHICSPGSTFASGNFNSHDRYRLEAHGFSVGFGGAWQEGFSAMLAHLKYPDAGGVTINHPTWFSHLSDEHVFELLDFDDRVLGIEIYNDLCGRRNWLERPGYTAPNESESGFSLNMWDRILSTGRRCWGFSVPDHSVGNRHTDWNGRNILLVPEFTEYECLKAYRQGAFYGCLKDNGLKVKDFSATESAIHIRISAAATIKFINETGTVSTIKGECAKYDIPQKDGAPDVRYVRIEIADDSGERIFLQPVMYIEYSNLLK